MWMRTKRSNPTCPWQGYGLLPPRRLCGGSGESLDLPERGTVNWLHVSTLVAVAILVGTEMVGASWAAGWALGGLLQLSPVISHLLEGLFALCGVVLLYYFMRTAISNESVRD
jgi:hypothetical protein